MTVKVKIIDIDRHRCKCSDAETELELYLEEGYSIEGQSEANGTLTYTLVLRTMMVNFGGEEEVPATALRESYPMDYFRNRQKLAEGFR